MGHTPGPWRASEGWPSDLWHVDMPGRKWSLLVARHDEDFDMPVEEVQANARLIAAAPDLLRGCQAAAAYLIDPASEHKINRGEAARIILAAIAKAEGRTNED
jgi:hypothetical protein